MKKISVVIPVFNRKETIIRAVQSVLNQSYPIFEVIIVDDGSTDCSVDFLKKNLKDERIKFIRCEENQGAAAARNKGIHAAEGEIIAFQDSDDEWNSDKLQKQMSTLIKGGFDVVYSRYLRCGEESKSIVPREELIAEMLVGEDLKELLKFENVIGAPTVIAKRKVLLDVGAFDSRMRKLEDYDLAIRLALQYKIGFIDEPLMKAYITENSVTFNNFEAEVYGLMNAKYPGFLKNNTDYEYIYNANKEKKDVIKRGFQFFINRNKNVPFAIYGTGILATRAIRVLEDLGMQPVFFVETNKTKDEFYGYKVMEIKECKDMTLPMLIAAGDKYRIEIMDTLLGLGYKDVTLYDT